MNERVKELAKQAGLIAPYGSDHEGLSDFDYRKFAELIVRECVNVGRTAFLNDNSTVPIFPTKQIKEHFGVEE